MMFFGKFYNKIAGNIVQLVSGFVKTNTSREKLRELGALMSFLFGTVSILYNDTSSLVQMGCHIRQHLRLFFCFHIM